MNSTRSSDDVRRSVVIRSGSESLNRDLTRKKRRRKQGISTTGVVETL